MKLCTKCKIEKTLEEFNFKSKEKGIYQSHCKVCTRNFVKNHYNENKGYYLAKALKRNRHLREKANTYIRNYLLEHPCVDCGEKDPVVLEFDHTGGVPKSNDVSYLVRYQVSLERIREEIGKCVVRCANCHRRKTAKDFGWFKIMRP